MPIRVEASEATTPRPASAPRKRRGAKVTATRPKKSKGSSSTKQTASVVEETTVAPSVEPEQDVPNLSAFVEMFDPAEEEVEEAEVLLTSRRRRPVDPPVVEEPEALAMVVADVLGDIGPAEVTVSRPVTDAEAGDAQSFAFDTGADEEPPAEVQVDQPAEVTRVGIAPGVAPVEVEEDVIKLASPPRDQVITAPPESSFQTPPATQSLSGSTARFYERFVVQAARPPTGTWLCCSGYPFFTDLPNVPQEQLAFFDRIFAKEGDIFEGSSCD